MSVQRGLLWRLVTLGALILGVFLAGACGLARAEEPRVTACTVANICYCIASDKRNAINANIQRVRQLIADQRTQGKAIGYISIPLSTTGGGYIGVNTAVAGQIKKRLEARFGAGHVWMLDPAAEANLPGGATGADYMYMWTKILEGRNGLGEDFEFVYFAGPSDFEEYFHLNGKDDMERIVAFFDQLYVTDQAFKALVDQNRISRRAFRNHYGLRASVAFSYGSHDEWNIVRLLNERRRGADDFGIGNQIAIMFDGRATSPADFEIGDAAGDVGRCVN
jgi:hypothetical protein